MINSFPEDTVALAAPTGRAARRLFEQTGHPASTIHRLLEPRLVGKRFAFSRNKHHPLDADLIVLDEVSMIDTPLMARFLEAVAPGTRLILVGDTDQLPSVGPGNILKDLLSSKAIPSTQLTQIKRQEDGLIVRACHRIKNGEDVPFENSTARDFFFLQRESEESVRETILDLVARRFPASHQADALRDIQIITPLREKTVLSCKSLNDICQRRLNPNPAIPGVRFRHGDKVIQTRNSYEQNLINGDIGYVLAVDGNPSASCQDGSQPHGRRRITVEFDNPVRTVELPLHGNDLELAYAITCVAPSTWIWTDQGLQQIGARGTDHSYDLAIPCCFGVGTEQGVRQATHVIRRRTGVSVKIRTQLGLELEMSLDHRVLTTDRTTGEDRWEHARNLTEGTKIPVPRAVMSGPTRRVSTASFSPSPRSNNRTSSRWPAHVDDRLAELLGMLTADGWYADPIDGRVEFSKAEPLLSYALKAVEDLFGVSCTTHRNPTQDIGGFCFHNKTTREFLAWCGLGYERASEKAVPRMILASPPAIQARFLRGLFTCDGAMTARVVLSTSSTSLAEQAQLILLNLGIVARRSLLTTPQGQSTAWRLDISGQEIDQFNAMVGFIPGARHEDAQPLREDAPLREDVSYRKTNRDCIPGGAGAARRLREALRQRDGRTYRASANAKRVLSQIARNATRLAYHHVDLLVSEIEKFDSLGPSAALFKRWKARRFFYDTIVEVGAGESEFYDLTVEDTHSYLSNGFVSHNCHKMQGSEARIVVIPIHRAFGPLIMQRSWLYTAVSRAKEVCVLIGQHEEIPNIIRRNKQQRRFTRLAQRLA